MKVLAKEGMSKNKTHGGARPGSGRPAISEKGSRTTVSVCLSPENLAFRKQIGRDWNDFVNRLLDQYRGCNT